MDNVKYELAPEIRQSVEMLKMWLDIINTLSIDYKRSNQLDKVQKLASIRSLVQKTVVLLVSSDLADSGQLVIDTLSQINEQLSNV